MRSIIFASIVFAGFQVRAYEARLTSGCIDCFNFTAPSIYGATNVGAPGTGLIVFDTQANAFMGYSSTGTWQTLTQGATAPAMGNIVNCSIGTSVSSNALTISLLDASGNTPSSTSACQIPFRNSTNSNGTFSVITVTAATTFTISSGSTMGCSNGAECSFHIYAINNSGTVELAAINGAINEEQVQSTTGGSGNSAGTLYSTTARTSKAVRHLGYVHTNETTAGTYASNADLIDNHWWLHPYPSYNFQISNTGAVTEQGFDVVNGNCTHGSTGTYGCTINTTALMPLGLFCQAIPISNPAGGNAPGGVNETISGSVVTFYTKQGGAFFDYPLGVTCTGLR